MSRMARVVIPNYPHHVNQRGNRRQKTFVNVDDYCYYLELMFRFSQQSKTEIWAYCLISNHIHMVMVSNDEDGLRATPVEATDVILDMLIFEMDSVELLGQFTGQCL